MRVVRGVMATTHVDSHGEAFTREALESMAAQVTSAIVPLGVEHDPRLPPAGRIRSAAIEPGPDGEALLVGDIEIFESGDAPPTGETRRLLPRIHEGAAPCVTHDNAFTSPGHQLDLSQLRSALGATGRREAKNSLEPLGILTIAGAFAAGAFASGFFEAAGKDAWNGAAGALKRLFATSDERGERLLVFEYSVPLDGEIRRVDVILSDPTDADIEAFTATRLRPVEDATIAAIHRDPSLARLVFSFDAKAGPILQYGVNERGYPAYFAAPVPTLPGALGLSPRGTISSV